MELVIDALIRQAKKEQDRLDKKDPKANEEYLDQLYQAIKVLKFAVAFNEFLDK